MKNFLFKFVLGFSLGLTVCFILAIFAVFAIYT